MWIMLTKKLPTQYSPPMMSIFWPVPWTDVVIDYNSQQRRRLRYLLDDHVDDGEVERYMQQGLLPGDFGWEPNWSLARKIHYRGHDIRVFPHEFSAVTKENLRLYVHGNDQMSPSHDLVMDNSPSEELLFDLVLNKELRPLYDAALVEGATHEQATSLAIGIDITYPDYDFPPLGWYKIRPEYGERFCEEWELREVY